MKIKNVCFCHFFLNDFVIKVSDCQGFSSSLSVIFLVVGNISVQLHSSSLQSRCRHVSLFLFLAQYSICQAILFPSQLVIHAVLCHFGLTLLEFSPLYTCKVTAHKHKIDCLTVFAWWTVKNFSVGTTCFSLDPFVDHAIMTLNLHM